MNRSAAVVLETVPATDVHPAVKRQRRSPELKRQIVEESLAPGASVARVARAHGVNANQLFQWRRQYVSGALGTPGAKVARLLPVHITSKPVEGRPPVEASAAELADAAKVAESSGANSIHLELRKARLRIDGRADPAVLRLVLKAVLG